MNTLVRISLMFILLVCSCKSKTTFTQQTPIELRGVWITNVDSEVLNSQESIKEAIQFLYDHHFNAVFPVVWNDAKTVYPSQVMKREFNVLIDPRYEGRDPLSEIITEAHSKNIAVIPWFEYGFAASYEKRGGLILERKSHWAARDNEGKLLTKNGFEWMNAYHPEVQSFMLELIMEVVQNYAVDGVQGDDRLPAQPIEGGYSSFTQSLYKSETGSKDVPKNFYENEWKKWRAAKLTEFTKSLYQRVKKIKVDIQVTWAPSIYPWSYDEYLQDWPSWIKQGYADVVIPQIYRSSWVEYKKALDSQRADSLGILNSHCLIFPGMLINVGDYVIVPEFLLKSIDYNRRQGYKGEVLFFYEGLRKADGRLANVLLATFYKQFAQLPFKVHSSGE